MKLQDGWDMSEAQFLMAGYTPGFSPWSPKYLGWWSQLVNSASLSIPKREGIFDIFDL